MFIGIFIILFINIILIWLFVIYESISTEKLIIAMLNEILKKGKD